MFTAPLAWLAQSLQAAQAELTWQSREMGSCPVLTHLCATGMGVPSVMNRCVCVCTQVCVHVHVGVFAAVHICRPAVDFGCLT